MAMIGLPMTRQLATSSGATRSMVMGLTVSCWTGYAPPGGGGGGCDTAEVIASPLGSDCCGLSWVPAQEAADPGSCRQSVAGSDMARRDSARRRDSGQLTLINGGYC